MWSAPDRDNSSILQKEKKIVSTKDLNPDKFYVIDLVNLDL